MTINKEKREVNYNLYKSLMALKGETQTTLGQKLDPPVSKYSVSKFINHAEPKYRLHEICKILGSNIATLFPKKKEGGKNAA